MGSFILKDVRVFTGDDTIENGFIYVADGKIKGVGEGFPNENSPTVKVISKPGHTVFPGLIDAHIHADKGNVLGIVQSLPFGVTTVMDMHNEPHNIHKLKKMAAESKDVADIKAACLAATIENGWPIPVWNFFFLKKKKERYTHI
jgi:cytosine/adenosine deaminase-related metal-dependent hydrolase